MGSYWRRLSRTRSVRSKGSLCEHRSLPETTTQQKTVCKSSFLIKFCQWVVSDELRIVLAACRSLTLCEHVSPAKCFYDSPRWRAGVQERVRILVKVAKCTSLVQRPSCFQPIHNDVNNESFIANHSVYHTCLPDRSNDMKSARCRITPCAGLSAFNQQPQPTTWRTKQEIIETASFRMMLVARFHPRQRMVTSECIVDSARLYRSHIWCHRLDLLAIPVSQANQRRIHEHEDCAAELRLM